MARIYDNIDTMFSEGLQGIITNIGVKRVEIACDFNKKDLQFKLWMAQVASNRIDQMQDPE